MRLMRHARITWFMLCILIQSKRNGNILKGLGEWRWGEDQHDQILILNNLTEVRRTH